MFPIPAQSIELLESSGEIERVPLFDQRLFHYAHYTVPFDYSGLEWGWVHVGLSLDAYDNSVRQVYRRTGILGWSAFCSAWPRRYCTQDVLWSLSCVCARWLSGLQAGT